MRIAVLAGIPSVLATEFSRIRERSIGQNTRTVIWSPLPYREFYTADYATKLYKKFAVEAFRFWWPSSRSEYSSDDRLSAVLVCLEHGNDTSVLVKDAFFPEVLSVLIPCPEVPPAGSAPNKIRDATNTLASAIVRVVRLAEGALAAITKEVTSRDNRTPLLLPVHNFDRTRITALLSEVIGQVALTDSFQAIQRATRQFEAKNPLVRLEGNRGRHFSNPKGLVFKSPGSNRHGLARDAAGAHPATSCIIRSRLRLGASFDPRFHYDCIRPKGQLPVHWQSCHGQEVAIPSGRMHVNIAPNDHIR